MGRTRVVHAHRTGRAGGTEITGEVNTRCPPLPAAVASAVEFVLEGLHLSRKLNKDVKSGQTSYRG